MPNTRAVFLKEPIGVEGKSFQGGAYIFPSPIAQKMVDDGIASFADGTPVDGDYSNVTEYRDFMNGRKFKLEHNIVVNDGDLYGEQFSRQAGEEVGPLRTEIGNLREMIGEIKAEHAGILEARLKAFLDNKSESVSKALQMQEVELSNLAESRKGIEAEFGHLKNILAAGASYALSDGYAKRATSQFFQIMVWQAMTIASLVAWFFFIQFRLANLGDETHSPTERLIALALNLDWPGALMLAVQNAPFAIAIAFCGLQVSRHYAAERLYKKLSLELGLIDKYTASLSPEDQRLIKANFAERFFSGGGPAQTAEHSEKKGWLRRS